MDVTAARKLFGGLPVVSVATVGPDGSPHVVPLWFVWLEDALYVSTRRDGRTWRNAMVDPRVSVTIDVGRSWTEIAGVVVEGLAEPFAAEHVSMRAPMSAWHEKYRSLLAGEGFGRFTEEVRGFAFLRVEPGHLVFWDHARG
jgi:nitroimidazol reductase NimA-like FMN-containing flavoprotein (pyridoxamine 5'-phosphate oxidase superfamily)